MDEKEKKEYEFAVLVKSEEDLASVVAFVKAHDAEISMEPRAKKLTFAYEVKKVKEGVFANLNFKALPEDAKALENDLHTKSEVLRSMIIASPPPAETPSREMAGPGGDRYERRPRTSSGPSAHAATSDAKPAAPRPLSNEALEKKIEEILQ
jgi:ribosomal protein S6